MQGKVGDDGYRAPDVNPYRNGHAPARAKAIVRYRPVSVLALLGASLVVLAVSGFMFFQAAQSLCAIDLVCPRGAQTCTVVRRYGPIATRQTVEKSRIQSVNIGMHAGKSRTTYGVYLAMREPPNVGLTRMDSNASAEGSKLAIERHIASNVGAESLPTQDRSLLGAIPTALVGLAPLAFLLVLTGGGRLDFDFERGVIEHRRRRWPLPATRRTYRASDVERARVLPSRTAKGSTIYEIVLVVRGAGSVSLAGSAGGSKKANDDAAANINALLRKLRAEPPDVGA